MGIIKKVCRKDLDIFAVRTIRVRGDGRAGGGRRPLRACQEPPRKSPFWAIYNFGICATILQTVLENSLESGGTP